MLAARHEGRETGCLALFSDVKGGLHYDISPLGITSESEYDVWNENMMERNALEERSWISNYFWILDELLVTEVEFNASWYESALPEFEKCWEQIVMVRTGKLTLPIAKKRSGSKPEQPEVKRHKCLL
jgi:hypothetical protein